MVNILVPTDLSDLSRVAAQYAVRIAHQMQGRVTLLHVISIIQPTRASMRLKLKSLEKELLTTAQEDLEAFVEAITKTSKADVALEYKIVKGESFNDAVKREAKKLKADFIVMGTRGASGLKKYVVGSNTASVIDVSAVPVLVVPELAQFKKMRNVVYATDLKHIEKELKLLVPYLQQFNSVVHLVHVASSATQVSAIEDKIEAVVQKSGYKNVIIRVLVNRNVDEAIDHYVAASKADLLTTFTHEHGFYDKLFDRSITRKMAFQSKVPLLAFKQK